MPGKITVGIFALTGLGVVALSSMAYGQQMSEREAFSFKILHNPFALNRAVAIEQVEDGFGNQNHVTNTSNDSTAIGTLTEVQAILDGENSTVTVTASPTQTNTGAQGSTSNQTANVNIDN